MDIQELQDLLTDADIDAPASILLTLIVNNRIALSTIIEYLKHIRPEDATLISEIRQSQAGIIAEQIRPLLLRLHNHNQSSYPTEAV